MSAIGAAFATAFSLTFIPSVEAGTIGFGTTEGYSIGSIDGQPVGDTAWTSDNDDFAVVAGGADGIPDARTGTQMLALSDDTGSAMLQFAPATERIDHNLVVSLDVYHEEGRFTGASNNIIFVLGRSGGQESGPSTPRIRVRHVDEDVDYIQVNVGGDWQYITGYDTYGDDRANAMSFSKDAWHTYEFSIDDASLGSGVYDFVVRDATGNALVSLTGLAWSLGMSSDPGFNTLSFNVQNARGPWYVDSVTTIPEPGAAAMSGIAITLILLRRQR